MINFMLPIFIIKFILSQTTIMPSYFTVNIWVALFMGYAFHGSTILQLGVNVHFVYVLWFNLHVTLFVSAIWKGNYQIVTRVKSNVRCWNITTITTTMDITMYFCWNTHRNMNFGPL